MNLLPNKITKRVEVKLEPKTSTYILGISAFDRDAAAALIKDGEIISAAQEERFTRIKNDSSFPQIAINYCLEEAKISI